MASLRIYFRYKLLCTTLFLVSSSSKCLKSCVSDKQSRTDQCGERHWGGFCGNSALSSTRQIHTIVNSSAHQIHTIVNSFVDQIHTIVNSALQCSLVAAVKCKILQPTPQRLHRDASNCGPILENAALVHAPHFFRIHSSLSTHHCILQWSLVHQSLWCFALRGPSCDKCGNQTVSHLILSTKPTARSYQTHPIHSILIFHSLM